MAAKNSLVESQKKPTFSAYMMNDARRKNINSMIGGKDGQRFMSAVISAVSTNPALANCDYGTILSAALLGESLKLSPSPQLGHYYMVPFEDKKGGRTVATFVLGYKGYLQMALRSGYYKKIIILSIKDGEFCGYNPLTEDLKTSMIEDDDEREQRETVGYYAMFEYTNGFRKSMYWSKKKMLTHADKYSAAFSKDAKKGREPKYDKMSFADYEAGKVPKNKMWLYSSFWYQDFDGMALKTMLRQLISKWGIMSIEMQRAFESDMSIVSEDGGVEYFDEPSSAEKTPDVVIEETPSDAAPDAQEDFFPGTTVDEDTGEVLPWNAPADDPLTQ